MLSIYACTALILSRLARRSAGAILLLLAGRGPRWLSGATGFATLVVARAVPGPAAGARRRPPRSLLGLLVIAGGASLVVATAPRRRRRDLGRCGVAAVGGR